MLLWARRGAGGGVGGGGGGGRVRGARCCTHCCGAFGACSTIFVPPSHPANYAVVSPTISQTPLSPSRSSPCATPPPSFPFRRGQGAFQPLSWAGLLPTSGLKWDHHAATTTLAQQGLLNAIEMEGRLRQPSVPWANLSSRR